MSPHRVMMVLAAMLAVAAAATFSVPHEDDIVENADKCWSIMAKLELSADDQLKVHHIREDEYMCKEPGWNIYYKKKGKMPVTNFRMMCIFNDANAYVRAIGNDDIDAVQVPLLKGDKIFCATNKLEFCEEEAKKMISDNDVALNDEETGFVCKSDGSRAFFKKYSTSKPQQTNDFLCVHGASDGPHKIQALHLNEVHELGKKSSIFCKGSNSATNTQTQPSQQPSAGPVPSPQQPSSDFVPHPHQSGSNPAPPLQQPSFGPAPHQQQPSSGFVPHQQQSGANPLLPQPQLCSCNCPVAQAQYHGYYVPQPQYSGYPAPQYPAYPSGKKRSLQAQYQAYGPAPPPGYGPTQQCLCYCDAPANPSAPVYQDAPVQNV